MTTQGKIYYQPIIYDLSTQGGPIYFTMDLPIKHPNVIVSMCGCGQCVRGCAQWWSFMPPQSEADDWQAYLFLRDTWFQIFYLFSGCVSSFVMCVHFVLHRNLTTRWMGAGLQSTTPTHLGCYFSVTTTVGGTHLESVLLYNANSSSNYNWKIIIINVYIHICTTKLHVAIVWVSIFSSKSLMFYMYI